jgi:hypothetical protein
MAAIEQAAQALEKLNQDLERRALHLISKVEAAAKRAEIAFAAAHAALDRCAPGITLNPEISEQPKGTPPGVTLNKEV